MKKILILFLVLAMALVPMASLSEELPGTEMPAATAYAGKAPAGFERLSATEAPIAPATTARPPVGLERAAATENPAAPVEDSWQFTVGSTTYEIYMLQDVPESRRENLLDGREGHCILFTYASSDTSEASNSTLYDESKVITPSGEVIRTYSNAGNIANPYSLYYGLPDDVLLSDCMLQVPDDAGERLISLASAPETPVPPLATEAPANTPKPTNAPNAVVAAPLSNKDEVKPRPTEALQQIQPTAVPQPSTTGFEDIIVSTLQALAEEAKDPWQKAIYEAGAREFDVEMDEESQVLTFSLRSFDPNLKELGTYPGEAPAAWRAQMFEHISAYSLPVSITLKEDGLDEETARKALQRAVRAAAETTKAAFNKNAVRECLADAVLPSPAEKLTSLEDMITATYSDAFAEYAAGDLAPALDIDAYVPLFYGQVSQKLSIKDGPHALVLNCKGAAPTVLLEKASDSTLEALSQQYKANEMSADEITAVFYENLVQAANALRKKGATDFSLLMDIDSVIGGSYGVDYQNFLSAYTFDSTRDEMLSAVWALPDAPPQEYPKNGRLSGSSSGTKVIIKAPADGLARYVQVRRSDTDEVKVSLFLRPGGSGTVYVPSGFYYMLIASGESWYGEEGLFGEDGMYSQTSETEILGKKYYHTIELQTSSDGNISSWGADMDDFF